MRIDVLTLFEKMFEPVLGTSMLQRAQASGAVSYHVHDIRQHTLDKHSKVDATPYGGGPGMVMQCQPVWDCLEAIEAQSDIPNDQITRVVLSPQGQVLDQTLVEKLAQSPRLVLLAGHYEGFDERVLEAMQERPGKTLEISLGDYVLSGGELPAMVLIDAVVRLQTGVLGDDRSAVEDSFSKGSEGLLDHPHYTRPRIWEGREVPEVLLTGDHGKIEAWRKSQREERTRTRRPDLLGITPAATNHRSACIVIRDENKDDIAEVDGLLSRAFAPSTEEVALTHAVRDAMDAVLTHVAMQGETLVGHAMWSPMTLKDEAGVRGMLGLAPLAVDEPWRNQGIGQALVEEGIRRAKRARVRVLFLLGDPGYYRRFGFRAASELGYENPYGLGEEFQAMPLSEKLQTGVVRYCEAIEKFF